jgi:hypothetical protein
MATPSTFLTYTFLEPVGSRVTVSDTSLTENSDHDQLVLCRKADLRHNRKSLTENGFASSSREGSMAGEGAFESWKGPGNINVILTTELQFYDRFMVATELAKRFDLKEKTDRIALFQGVLYGASFHG